eukprot:COSAG02_NODE_853_length_16508_cov_5.643915_4_plen_297_part_00
MMPALLAACAELAAAQAQGPGIGSVPGDGSCDLGGVSAAIGVVNSRCCPNQPCTCTIPCSSVLLPLLDNCHPVLNAMLDTDDGVEDGVAGMLDDIKDQCLAIPPGEVLHELKEMHDNHTCSTKKLNGVAQTEVMAAPCTDSGRLQCATLMIAGLTCASMDMATNCRDTCNLCDRHRRAQITVPCPNLVDEANAVNTACCDYQGCTGVPTTCDAKCAIVYNDFFDRCWSRLEDSIDPSQAQAYRDLHLTCSTGLPTEPLLRAVIDCQVLPPPLLQRTKIVLPERASTSQLEAKVQSY